MLIWTLREEERKLYFFHVKKHVSHIMETYVKLNPKYSQIAIWGDFSLQLNITWRCFVRATQQGTIF